MAALASPSSASAYPSLSRDLAPVYEVVFYYANEKNGRIKQIYWTVKQQSYLHHQCNIYAFVQRVLKFADQSQGPFDQEQ
jgi:hypothetical protein